MAGGRQASPLPHPHAHPHSLTLIPMPTLTPHTHAVVLVHAHTHTPTRRATPSAGSRKIMCGYALESVLTRLSRGEDHVGMLFVV